MAKENLVPIIVKIGLKINANKNRQEHAYPAFNELDPAVRAGMDWSNYLDQFGIGWHYDKMCGHHAVDSYKQSKGAGAGTWLGATCVPEPFALAAVAKFPESVTIVSEAEFEEFYDTRGHAHEPEIHVDEEILKEIKLGSDLANSGLDASAVAKVYKTDPVSRAKRNAALDPDDPAPGIRRNKQRFWATFKADQGLTILPKHRKV